MTSVMAWECPPVLFIVFRRPETTRRVMECIRAARPSRLYVAADGPRAGREGEAEACRLVREIATAVDWPCRVQTLFREDNLGCRMGVSTAIDWFFGLEEEGIILEDDVVPVPDFFRFCAELLDRYRHDARIGMIGGTNFQGGTLRGAESYYFSRMTHVWGWASWRRAWLKYDRKMEHWKAFRQGGGFSAAGWHHGFESWYAPNFDAVAAGRIDTWDHQWLFSCLSQNMLSVIPQANLVTNIGFGKDATHTRNIESRLSRMETGTLEIPLRHPRLVVPNIAADWLTVRIQRHPLPLRVLGALRKKLISWWT